MKQLYYKIVYILLFIFSIGNITAQTCSSNFTVKTTQVASTCQANGSITVTLEGDLTNISNVQYGVTNANGILIVRPQGNNVLPNLAPGTYSVTVRAFCAVDEDYDVVKTIANVTVGGNYKVPTATFVDPSSAVTNSRKSYDKCNTGIIVLDVKDGNGDFTFNIKYAPAGVTTGTVTPIKTGTTYRLPGENYPAGDYTVLVSDSCYTAAANFNLGQVTGFPPYVQTTSISAFYPTFVANSCNNVYWYAGAVGSSNADYLRYYTDGMYEVGAAPAGSIPTAWTAWTAANLKTPPTSSTSSIYCLLLDIAPYNVSNFYANNSISIYTRLKGCPSNFTSLTTNIKSPTLTNGMTRNCANYTYSIKPWYDYDGVVCYPLSIKVTKVNDESVPVYTNPSWMYSSGGQPVTLDYGTNYRVTMTDLNNTVMTTTTNVDRAYFSFNSVTDIPCSPTYTRAYSPSEPCYPINVTITEALTGTVIHTKTLTNALATTVSFEYGKAYTFTATYPGSNPAVAAYTYDIPIRNAPQMPTAYTIAINSPNACIEDNARLYIYSTGGIYFPAGTIMTVTGPPGYTTQTYTSSDQASGYYFPYTTLPAGTYTLTVYNPCDGTTKTTVKDLLGGYSGKNLKYTSEVTCNGLRVFPSGAMTLSGANTTTYYRLSGGPGDVYDKTVISAGGSFFLGTEGTYTLGILNINSATACVIKSIPITYTKPKLVYDSSLSGGYECVDSSLGIILARAQGGGLPYTYELWDETNTIKIPVADIVSSTENQVHFEYGQAGETYTIRFNDACGNKFPQPVRLANLRTERIVYVNPKDICTGETIKLKCATLGNTGYMWTGPNGFTSELQNPEIPNAQANMSGWYKVSVLPEFCGAAVKDSAYVTVYAPLAAGALTGNQGVCVRTTPSLISCAITGGSGIYTYQWQKSEDGTTNWENILSATSAIYVPASQIKSGPHYYKVVVSDRCGTVTSNTITVNVKPCTIPVNPNIKARVGVKK